MASRVHDSFREIKIHTAKCDTCNKHNKLTIYRCKTCGFQQCTPCWNRKGDNQHEFTIPSPIVPTPPAAPAVNTGPDVEQQDVTADAQEPESQTNKRKIDVLSDLHDFNKGSHKGSDNDNDGEIWDGLASTEEDKKDAKMKKQIAAIKDADNGNGESSNQVIEANHSGGGVRKKRRVTQPLVSSDKGHNDSAIGDMAIDNVLSNPSQAALHVRQPTPTLYAANLLLELANGTPVTSSPGNVNFPPSSTNPQDSDTASEHVVSGSKDIEQDDQQPWWQGEPDFDPYESDIADDYDKLPVVDFDEFKDLGFPANDGKGRKYWSLPSKANEKENDLSVKASDQNSEALNKAGEESQVDLKKDLEGPTDETPGAGDEARSMKRA